MLSHMGKKLQAVTLMYYSTCLGSHFSLYKQKLFAECGKTMLKVKGFLR